ncbi:hypothetical protein NTE_02129 [Candidatus Nitrososphaera evergladensis SR1]|jgi:hypothetical protein|uniref:Histidine kinase N-terminal 7TM region domain-containing protein n=2 Tax=Nitrososphaera TaxID=497726 RepID=A0A075MY29_9ARCH|nr:hypothetical protein NTE_02129 [Candidatus Nitrososphaera evergladensis SR1]
MAAIAASIALAGDKSDLARDMSINATAIAAAGSSVFAVRAQKVPAGKRLVGFLAAALFSWLAAELAWSYMLFVLDIDPYPSAADLLYLAGYGFAAYVVFSLYRTLAARTQETRMVLLVGAVTVEALFLNLFLIQIVESAMGFGTAGNNNDPVVLAISVAYPLLDGALIVPAAVIVVGYRSALIDKFSIIMLVAALISIAVADTGFGYVALQDRSAEGAEWDLLYCLSYLCFAGAMLNTYSRLKGAKTLSVKEQTAAGLI